MARPVKNSCDYFSHDAGMRNHRKIKSVRQKFGINGYGIWCMLIEYLTASDGNEFENSDLEYELMSGDFGVSVTEIREVVNYCISLELLFNNNGFVFSESLNERLASVYQKRGRKKELSKNQLRKNGQFVSNNADSTVVSATETPQSKVNKIKEKESINVPFDSFWNLYDKKVGDKDKLIKKWEALTDDERLKAMQHIPKYKESQPDKKYRKDPSTYLNNKSFNDEIIGENTNNIFSSNPPRSSVYTPGVTVCDHESSISIQEQHRIWIEKGEYWRIEYGHLASTREEFDALVTSGEIS